MTPPAVPLPGSTVLLVNGHARSGREGFAASVRALDRLGMVPDQALAVSDPSQFAEVVRAQVASGARTVLVGGGDGTVSAAAEVLVNRDVVLGVIPLGTGNDFARALGIPVGAEAACSALANSVVQRVDVGSLNDGTHHFLNAVTIGLTTEITRLLNPRLKRMVGGFAYAWATLGALKARKPFRTAVTVDGERFELDALQVVAGNGRYQGGGRLVAPEATLDDGLLDVYLVKAPERSEPAWREALAFARFAGRLEFGRHLEDERVTHLRCRRVLLECDPSQAFYADGEEGGASPVTLTVVPRALQVRVPAPT